MSASPDERLMRLLGGEHLAALRKRLRVRFEQAQGDFSCFRIGALTLDEYQTLATLQGRPVRNASSMTVEVAVIDGALRDAGIAASLRDALEQLDGPIVHRATALREQAEAWESVAQASGDPRLANLLGTRAGLTLLKRLSKGDPDAATRLCERSCLVLPQLPAAGMPRAQLAARTLGDAHALDDGRPAASLVLAVWRHVVLRATAAESYAAPMGDDNVAAEDARIERTRDIWAKAGVLVNELARPALHLNVPRGDRFATAPGEPHYDSLRFLLRTQPAWDVGGRVVYICENPNVVAIAADELGARCAPLVCTDGMPAAAQRVLLSQLVGHGARLCYHGDFDWPGLRIAQHVIDAYGASPWRFGSNDYAAAALSAPRPGHRLEGTEASASWDPALVSTMRTTGLSIPEESVTELLLADLKTGT